MGDAMINETNETNDTLYIIIPAYNEEANIENTARDWHDIVEKTGGLSRLIIIDDGSKDNTYSLLKKLESELPRLVSITKANGGHGSAILFGYNYALENGADYIFQTDSDGQTSAFEFWNFWEIRASHSAIIGHRKWRKDGRDRVFVTNVLRLLLLCIFGLWIPDANAPFRLIKKDALKRHIGKIPEGFFLTNIIMSVFFLKGGENVLFMPVSFGTRQGGENSLNIKKIIKIGFRAVFDFMKIRTQVKRKKTKHRNKRLASTVKTESEKSEKSMESEKPVSTKNRY
jgi:glycosyltransferase involved in cell wall biosynthesis